jgi:hypothetical protein
MIENGTRYKCSVFVRQVDTSSLDPKLAVKPDNVAHGMGKWINSGKPTHAEGSGICINTFLEVPLMR